MKHVNLFSKYLLVALFTLGLAQNSRAQAPDAVFDQIAAGLAKGDATAMIDRFNSSVEVFVPGADQSYSAQQAAFVIKDFLAKNPVKGFNLVHKGSSGATWYATGLYTASTGNYDSNIFVKKVGEKYLITQVRFEAE